jgi:hypothetical protein
MAAAAAAWWTLGVGHVGMGPLLVVLLLLPKQDAPASLTSCWCSWVMQQ